MVDSILTRELQLIKNKEKYGMFLFVVGLCLELLVMVTDNCSSWTIPYRGRIVQVAFLFFLLKICVTKYNGKQWIYLIPLGLLGIISYLTCEEELVIRMVVFVAASKDIDIKLCVRILLIGTAASSIIIVLLSLLGICGQVVDIRHYGRGVEEARYNLGFNHANNVQDTLWMIQVLYVIIRNRKYSVFDAIAWTAANVLLYILTASRTGLIVIEMIAIGCLVANCMEEKLYAKIVYFINAICLSLCVFLTVWCSRFSLHESKLEAFLDPFFTGRLAMVSERTDLRSWKILPIGMNSADVDNGFAVIGYSYGYVVLVVLIAAIMLLARKIYKQNNARAGILLISVVFVIFMESTFIFNVSLTCNLLLILLMVYGMNDGVNPE